MTVRSSMCAQLHVAGGPSCHQIVCGMAGSRRWSVLYPWRLGFQWLSFLRGDNQLVVLSTAAAMVLTTLFLVRPLNPSVAIIFLHEHHGNPVPQLPPGRSTSASVFPAVTRSSYMYFAGFMGLDPDIEFPTLKVLSARALSTPVSSNGRIRYDFCRNLGLLGTFLHSIEIWAYKQPLYRNQSILGTFLHSYDGQHNCGDAG